MLSPQHRRNLRTTDPLKAGLLAGFRVKKKLHLDEWAEKHIVLSEERASSPGPFRIGDASYQRGMFRSVTNPDNELICFLTSSQVGKTSILNAAQGYYAEHEPSPQLSVFPDNIVAEKYCQSQFDPTIRDCAALLEIFDGHSYPGGYIDFVGANTPAKLAMRPMRILTGDEVDRWPKSSGREGTPRTVAERRLNTYRGSRKAIYCSTPLDVKTSEITAIFLTCEQFYFHVVCPHCDHAQILKWDNVHYTKHQEEKAVYVCDNPSCGTCWGDIEKRRLVRDAEKHGGGWLKVDDVPFKAFRPTKPFVPGRIGFWVNELYSPWSSLEDMARGWTEAEGNPEAEKAFINTRLGLPWDGDVSSVADAEQLRQRREEYDPKTVPAMAGLVTAAVDVQDDRLEILTVAWGQFDECWLLEHIRIDSDPSVSSTWARLTEVLLRQYPHAKGEARLKIEAVAIDSGGHFTQEVYNYSGKFQRMGRPWHAIKGIPGEGKPLWKKSEMRNKVGCKLFLVGVDDGKTTLYTRYGSAPGAGRVHLHVGITDEEIEQMTAEFCETEYPNGFPKRKWEKKPGRRNEMLDLMVYNMAARADAQIDMNMRLRALHKVEDKAIDAAAIGALYK